MDRLRSNSERLRLKVLNDLADARETTRNKIMNGYIPQFCIAENYSTGKIEIELCMAARANSHEWEFIVFTLFAENVMQYCPSFSSLHIDVSESHVSKLGHCRKCYPVLVGAGDSAEQPQCVVSSGVPIPSRIRLKRAKNGVQIRGDLLASIFTESDFEVVRRLPEGEMSISAATTFNMIGCSRAGLIQRISQILNTVGSDISKARGDWFKHQLSVILSSNPIYLFDHSIRVSSEKFAEFGIELIYVGFNSRQ